jgi:outer membrane biosynthesis protein TonB
MLNLERWLPDQGRMTMASTERIFFAGVATTVLLIGAGFGGGVMLGKTAMAPVPESKLAQSKIESRAPSPPDRIVLPAITETSQHAATPPPVAPIEAAIPAPPEPQTEAQPEPQVVPTKDIKKKYSEKDKQAERQAEAEKQKAERADRRKKAAEKERRHQRYAERKARQEIARQQQEQEEHQQQAQAQQQHDREARSRRQFGVVAFDDGDEPAGETSFYYGD